MPVAFSRFLAVLPLHNIHMGARLSGLSDRDTTL